jgi:hypothetical protein
MVQVPKTLHEQKPAANRKGSPDDIPAMVTLHRDPSTKKVPVQLKLAAEMAREFRVFCAARDLDMSSAFILMFDEYRKTHGR